MKTCVRRLKCTISTCQSCPALLPARACRAGKCQPTSWWSLFHSLWRCAGCFLMCMELFGFLTLIHAWRVIVVSLPLSLCAYLLCVIFLNSAVCSHPHVLCISRMGVLNSAVCSHPHVLCISRMGVLNSGVMSKVAFKGIPYPCMAMLPVLSPSPYAIRCIEQVSTIENVVMYWSYV